ncbi:MFS general substrate transporter [Mucidula mucida]|nr:MFS general substrate transporter [Mucidula mucida]
MTAAEIDEQSPLLAENGEVDGDEGKPKALAPIVIPMTFGIFLAAMDQTIVVSSYAAIGSELEQLQKTSWIATGYMLTLTSFQPLYGKLSDIFGRKSCLLTAYCIFLVGSLLCGLARTMDELILARAIAGVGGAGMSTVVSIILSDVVPLRNRGTWQARHNQHRFCTGSSVGAPLGGLLADTIGWRWAFLFQVPIAFIAIVSVSIALKLPTSNSVDFVRKIKRVDFSGAFSLVTTIFFLLYGLEHGGNVSWSDRSTMGALVFSGVAFVIFSAIEMEWASEPFAPKRIIVNRALIASYLVNFFGVAAAMSMLFHLSLYLQAVQGKSPSEAGLWFIPSVIGGVVGSLAGGLIMQATGKFYWITVISYVMQFAGTLVVALWSGVVGTSLGLIITGLVVASIGNGCGITTSLISLIANAGNADQAIATAVSYLFRSLGSVVGLSIGSTLKRLTGSDADIDEIIRNVRSSLSYISTLPAEMRAAVQDSYEQAIHACFWFTVGMALCALAASLFIKEKPLGGSKDVPGTPTEETN